jgi:hypothetical protein
MWPLGLHSDRGSIRRIQCVGAQDYTVRLLLFCLQMSFSIDFANNLIEKSQTSATQLSDYPRPPKNRGNEEWWGSTTISCEGSATGELCHRNSFTFHIHH